MLNMSMISSMQFSGFVFYVFKMEVKVTHKKWFALYGLAVGCMNTGCQCPIGCRL